MMLVRTVALAAVLAWAAASAQATDLTSHH